MFKNILSTFGTKLVSAVINLTIAIIISQLLGPEGKGTQGLFLATMALLLLVANILGPSSLVYLVPRHPLKQLVFPSIIWIVLTTFASYIMLRLFNLSEEKFIVHICALVCIASLFSLNTSVLVAKKRIQQSNIIVLIQAVLMLFSFLILSFVVHHKNIFSYILALYFSYGLTLIISFKYTLNYYRNKADIQKTTRTGKLIKYMFAYGIQNQAATFFQLLSFRLSYFILNHYYGKEAVGIYSNGISIVESIWLISRSIALVQHSEIVNTSDKTLSLALTAQLARVSLIITTILSFLIVLIPSSFYVFLFGDGFAPTAVVIRLLAPGIILFNLVLVLGHYFSGTGKFYVHTITQGLGLTVTLLCLYLLVPSFSFVGAAISTTISYTCTLLAVLYYYKKDSGESLIKLMPSKPDISLLISRVRQFLNIE